MKICFLMLGKTRRRELCALFDEYLERIARCCTTEVITVRDSNAALKKLDVHRTATRVLLDSGGKAYDSETFARWIANMRDHGTKELVFLCGDANGFPDVLRQRSTQTISLSAMTFSHELARVMLAEQIYRAFAILSGSPYPK